MEPTLRPEQLRSARLAAGLTQTEAADRLGVSQAYLALLESGRRPVTPPLASRIVHLYALGPIALPLRSTHLGDWDSSSLAEGLASLGYPGFRQPKEFREARALNQELIHLRVHAEKGVREGRQCMRAVPGDQEQ